MDPITVTLRGLHNGQPLDLALGGGVHLLGRAADCNVVLEEPSVSRRHARIYREPGGRVVIDDNQSQNGIQVEGRRTARNLLKNGWRVTIGGIEFVYREGQANTEPKLPAND